MVPRLDKSSVRRSISESSMRDSTREAAVGPRQASKIAALVLPSKALKSTAGAFFFLAVTYSSPSASHARRRDATCSGCSVDTRSTSSAISRRRISRKVGSC